MVPKVTPQGFSPMIKSKEAEDKKGGKWDQDKDWEDYGLIEFNSYTS